MDDERYVAGAVAALDGFRAELLSNRDNIENDGEPVFDVIMDLLDRTLAVLGSIAT
jgi:hypothetical protein